MSNSGIFLSSGSQFGIGNMGLTLKTSGIVPWWPQLNVFPKCELIQSVLLFLASLFLLLISSLLGSRFEGSIVFGSSLSLDCNCLKNPLDLILRVLHLVCFLLALPLPQDSLAISPGLTFYLNHHVWNCQCSPLLHMMKPSSQSHNSPRLSLGSSHKSPPCYHVSCHTNGMIVLLLLLSSFMSFPSAFSLLFPFPPWVSLSKFYPSFDFQMVTTLSRKLPPFPFANSNCYCFYTLV